MKVFVSYSSTDRKFVTRLATDLKERGLDVWLDIWNITGRDPYWQEIEQAIEESTHVLFVISPDSIEEGCAARDELGHAKHHKKKIVVVMARSVDYDHLPIEITPGRDQIHDFTTQPYDDALRSTAKALYGSHEVLTPLQKKERDWLTIVGIGTLVVFVSLIGLTSLLSGGNDDDNATPDLAGLNTNTPDATITLLPAEETVDVTAALTDTVDASNFERVTQIKTFPCEGTVIEDLTPYYRAASTRTREGTLEEGQVLSLQDEESSPDGEFYEIEIERGQTHYILQDDVDPAESCP
ncbi:MAG: toll/interleukin-1 receptor domain-containing protein [Chloroflexi bacterium]|nr:toll/interleukin-1 receptor domain-containing protein [Chloroflexota bacterium]